MRMGDSLPVRELQFLRANNADLRLCYLGEYGAYAQICASVIWGSTVGTQLQNGWPLPRLGAFPDQTFVIWLGCSF